jgi:hypothetical protein
MSMTPSQAWEQYVGNQSPREFMECGTLGQSADEAAEEYVREIVTNAWFAGIDEPDEEHLAHIATLLAQHIRNTTE